MENEFHNLLKSVLETFPLKEIDDWDECPFCQKTYWDREESCTNPDCLGVRIKAAIEKFEGSRPYGQELYTIRLKYHPHLFIGKSNASYALMSDEEIAGQQVMNSRDTVDNIIGVHSSFFKPVQYAKVWTSLTTLKRFLKYMRYGKNPVFSYYELLRDGRVIPFPKL